MRHRWKWWPTVLGVVVVVAAACSPTPAPAAVPSYYLSCSTTPTCVITSTSQLVLPLAVSDDGQTMAATHSLGGGLTAVELVQRTAGYFHQVLVAQAVHGVSLSADGAVLAVSAQGIQGGVGADGLYVFHRSDGSLTRPAQPALMARDPSMDPTGRWVATTETTDLSTFEVSVVDLQAGTSQDVGSSTCLVDPHVSSGGLVVWGPRNGSCPAGPINLYRAGDGTTTTLDTGLSPVISGDGSRVVWATAAPFFGHYLTSYDVASETSSVEPAPAGTELYGPFFISTDGTRLFAWQDIEEGVRGLTQWDLVAGTYSVLPGTDYTAGFGLTTPVAASPNARHLIFIGFPSDPFATGEPAILWSAP
jgi:hypothetical protein